MTKFHKCGKTYISRDIDEKPAEATLDEQVEELDRQIAELQQKRQRLAMEADKEYQTQAQSMVGKCFKYRDSSLYMQVIGVPHADELSYHYRFDRNMYPVFRINPEYSEEVPPMEYDDIFMDQIPDSALVEISRDEYIEQFDRMVNKLRSEVI